jgi:hypothetical protein
MRSVHFSSKEGFELLDVFGPLEAFGPIWLIRGNAGFSQLQKERAWSPARKDPKQ